MKKSGLLIMVVLFIILSGCRTTKKLSESTLSTYKSSSSNQQSNSQDKTNITNDKISDLETTTIKTEFYQPGAAAASDTSQHEIQNSTGYNTGAVKSITTTKTKRRDVDKGKTELDSKKQDKLNTGSEDKTNEKSKQSEQSTPAPWPWKLIASIVLLIVSGVLYLLVRKKVIEIPLLLKFQKWLKSLF